MKVECLYSQGTAPYQEDGAILSKNIFGVLDGVSAPYAPKYPIQLFDGMSGGEMVSRFVEQFFKNVTADYGKMPEKELVKEVLEANTALRGVQKNAGVNVEDPSELAGATFAIAKVNEKTIEIVQAGDCFALWIMKDSSIGITENQVRAHDTFSNAELDWLQVQVAAEYGIKLSPARTEEELKPIREEVWNRFYPFLKEARRQDVNNPSSSRSYGRLDGNPRLAELMVHHKLPRQKVQTLILFTDGIFPWTRMKNMTDEEIGRQVYETYLRSGLCGLLDWGRREEDRVRFKRYLSYAEATVIAIDLR